MAWPVHNFIGGALPLPCFVPYIMSTPWWTGALSLWMIFAGSSANHLQDHSQVPSFCFWWLLAAPWVGRRQLLAFPTPGWGSLWPQTYNWSGWHPTNMNWSLQCWTKWLTTRPSRSKNWTVPWVGCSGPLTAAHSQSHSFKPFGNGNQL